MWNHALIADFEFSDDTNLANSERAMGRIKIEGGLQFRDPVISEDAENNQNAVITNATETYSITGNFDHELLTMEAGNFAFDDVV